MSHNIELKEGAFILGDAHYSSLRPKLLDFLKAIDAKKLAPTQLILMGDIFDTLFGGVEYTQQINAQAIELINNISKNIEVLYLEGNHDFNLSSIFLNIKVFSINQQPILADYNGKKVLLAHGDFDGTFTYKVYTSIARNPLVIFFLNTIDRIFNHIIINKLDRYLSKKDDCKEFVGFKEFTEERITTHFKCHYFIEGHFHQNKIIEFDDITYVNLGAFACNQRYFIVKSSKEELLLEEKSFKG